MPGDKHYKNKYLQYKQRYLRYKSLLNGGNKIINKTYIDNLAVSIKEISKEIYKIYEHEYQQILFIFIGSSPAYLSHYFIKCYQDINSIIIPISGLSLIFKPNYFFKISPEQNFKFCKYISKFIPTDKKDINKFVIIDHSHTGNSITNFIKLFSKCSGLSEKKIEFCNLVDYITPLDMIKFPKNIDKINIIRGNHINDMSGHIIPRLTKQIHFTTIVNKSNEEIDKLLEDRTELKKGDILIKILNNYYC